MTLQLHNLQSSPNSRRSKKRIGRGNASGHGTTATRGTKGQRARQGGRKGLTQLGVKHFVTRLPKVRGFQSFKVGPQIVDLNSLAKASAGAIITSAWLAGHKLIKDTSQPVKIIGQSAKLPKDLTVKVQAVTKGARLAIEAASGKVELVPLTDQSNKKE